MDARSGPSNENRDFKPRLVPKKVFVLKGLAANAFGPATAAVDEVAGRPPVGSHLIKPNMPSPNTERIKISTAHETGVRLHFRRN